MDNIYLIYGDEEFLIDKEIKNIINKSNSSMENVARYNLDESNVREAIEDACTISMFETNKINHSSFVMFFMKSNIFNIKFVTSIFIITFCILFTHLILSFISIILIFSYKSRLFLHPF